jgi:hypothetical protein
MYETTMENELDNLALELRELQQISDPENYVRAISGTDLLAQTFAPMEYVVKGLLPKGLSILSGAPKVGKSWLAMDLCLHIAKGEPFWGMEVTQGTAWYLSLEDNNERVHRRLSCLTAEEKLDNLFFTTKDHDPGTMTNGLPNLIDKFMKQHPDTKLIVIDTMQMAKGTGKDPNYGSDYIDTGAFKDIADKHHVALLLIHHLRKQGDPNPFNRISGSTGTSGAADSLYVLDKPEHSGNRAKLSCTGREIAERELILRFDKNSLTWEKVGDNTEQDAPQLPPEMNAFANFVKSIGKYEGGNTALAEQFIAHSGISIGPKGLKQKMNRWRYELEDEGVRFRSFDTNAGKMVSVYYDPPISHTTQISQN